MDFKVNDVVLEESLAKVEGMRKWSPRVISKLEATIRSADDEELFRINPVKWAVDKHIDEYEGVDLYLYAAKAGLFYMEWNVICPCCGKITQSLRDLHALDAQINCTVCLRRDKATLDDYVQVAFTLSPAIRSLRFHHPETLTLEDYCFIYLTERSANFSGLSPRALIENINKYFATFSPGEQVTIELQVPPHSFVIIDDLYGQKGFILLVDDQPADGEQTLKLRLTEAGFEVPLQPMDPGEYRFGHKFIAGDIYPYHPGEIRLEFEQASSLEAALLVAAVDIEFATVFPDADFPPCLTAKRLFTSQTFHDLYRSEVFQESQGFSIKDVTILFTDLKSSTQLYQHIGDLNAFALVREHYGVLNKAILDQHGAVVKTIGDSIMATFTQPADAVAAGLEMLENLVQMNRTSHHGELILKVGIHRGAAISVNLNDRIDYFGQTVNIASRVQGIAGGNEIFITDEIYQADGVQELLEKSGSQPEPVQVQLKGVDEQVKIYRARGGLQIK